MSERYLASSTAEPRPAPVDNRTIGQKIRADFFSTVPSALLTSGLGLAILSLGYLALRWGVLDAVFTGRGDMPAAEACRLDGAGACWAVIGDKLRLILFGIYPFAEQWRAFVACVLMTSLYALSVIRALWRPSLILIWMAVLAAVGVLLWGGVFGLTFVPEDKWGGLPVTLILSTFGLAFAFPIAVLLALARQATDRPLIHAVAVAYIEFARGVPLLVVLFMASVMMPLFLPQDMQGSKLLRVLVAFTLFAAAYLAEVIRGGLQAVPKGQFEAASALALGYWRTVGYVVLPQALRISIPGIVNVFIGFFKATAIVVVVGIFDLMTAAKQAVSDPLWQGFSIEIYLFAGLIYFAYCFSLSRYSTRLERDLSQGMNR